jgi:hypothetical protein
VSNARWFYAHGQQQAGPVSFEELRQLAASGRVRREDMVWAEGTPAWLPAGTQPALFDPSAVAPIPAGPGSIGYFQPAAGLPPRAAETLRGHAAPRGDVGDWPLDDARVQAFQETLKLRRKVTGAAQLYRSLLFLSLIAFVILVLVGVFTIGGNPRARTGAISMLSAAAVIGGFCALYWIAARATMRSHRWAPLTMLIIFLAGIALNVVSLAVAVLGNALSAAVAGYTAGAFVGMLLPTIFAIVSWRSYSAIPQYLGQPAWCQEIIVKAGM